MILWKQTEDLNSRISQEHDVPRIQLRICEISRRNIAKNDETYANRIHVSLVTEECLFGFLFPQIPQFAGFVDRAGDVSITVGGQTDAHYIACVRL